MAAGYAGVGKGYANGQAGYIGRGKGFVKFGAATVSPTITLNPASQSVDEYGNVTFTGAATGDEPITYQWYKNGSPVGANSTSYTLTAAAADNGATVYFTATNASGSATSSTATLTVVSYVFQLDGVAQYFNLSESVAFAAGDSVEFDISFPTSAPASDAYVIDGSTRAYLFVKSDGTLFYNSSRVQFTLDGAPIASGGQMPLDGMSHTVVGTYQGSHTLRVAGISYPLSSGTTLACKIKELSMVRVAGNIYIPLNNKAQGASQLATVGSVNATIVNYNAANWVAV